MTEMDLAPVLKVMDDLANDSATAIRRDSSVKMNRAMSAVRANKGAGNCALERFGAFSAERRDDARGLCFTFFAYVVVRSDHCGADRTDWRVEERRNRAQTTKLCQRRHISTSCALSPTSSRQCPAAQFPRADFFPATATQVSLGARHD